jgi:hypothetical protein
MSIAGGVCLRAVFFIGDNLGCHWKQDLKSHFCRGLRSNRRLTKRHSFTSVLLLAVSIPELVFVSQTQKERKLIADFDSARRAVRKDRLTIEIIVVCTQDIRFAALGGLQNNQII